ncbi:MAG: MFS transporter [Anaerovorax sp.]
MKKYRTSKKLLLPMALFLPFFLGFQSGGFQFALLSIGKEFTLNNVYMGSLVSAQFAAMVFAPLLLGPLIDRFGKKKLALASSMTFAFGCFTLFWTPTILVFILGIFLVGVGFSICQSSMSAALSDAYPGKAARYINLSQCFYGIGAVLSPVITHFLITNLGFSWKFLFGICGLGFAILMIPLFFTQFALTPDTHNEAHESLFSLLASKKLVCLIVALAFYVAYESGFSYFINSFFTNSLNAPKYAAFAISVFWLSMIPSRIITSIFNQYRTYFIAFGFAASSISFLLLSLVNSGLSAFLLCIALGVFSGPLWPTLVGVATEESPENAGKITSLMLCATGIGGAFAPTLMGTISDLISIRASYVALGLIAFLGFALMLHFLKLKHTPHQSFNREKTI